MELSLGMTNFKTDDRPTKREITTKQTGREVMTDRTYNVVEPEQGVPIKAWIKGGPLEHRPFYCCLIFC